MLTGRRAFDGEDIADTLAFVLTRQPDWTALPTDTPAAIERLLRRCLEKDRKQRLDSAASARLDVEDALKPQPIASVGSLPVAPVRSASRLPWVIAAAASIVAATMSVLWAPWRSVPEPAKVSFELQADTPAGGSGAAMLALSPDGKLLVARLVDTDGNTKLWLRPLDRPTWTPIPGTEGGTYPFWSPDGRHIGFGTVDGALKIIDVLAPPAQTLVERLGGAVSYGGTWNKDGVILFGQNTGPLLRVSASGGQPVQATELNIAQGETLHRFPRFLPDGDHFLYLVRSTKPEASGIYVGSLTSKSARRIAPVTTSVDFAAPNLLLFLGDNTLMAQRFDLRHLEPVGQPVQVATAVFGSSSGAAGFSVSDNGVLAMRRGTEYSGRQLTWVDQNGKPAGTIGTPALYENPRLSPDGKRLAVFRQENGGDIWISDLERSNSNSIRLTFDPAVDNVPVWSSDGHWIAFSSNRDGGVFNLYRKSAGGTGDDELLLKTSGNKFVDDWRDDVLLYEEVSPQTKTDIWMLRLSGDKKPTRLLGTSFNEGEATLSPDGKWIAYVSDENGARQVFVQSFPLSEKKSLISNSRVASHPRWRQDGRQLLFDGGGTLNVVDVTSTTDGLFKASLPRRMFGGLLDLPPHNFDVADGGRRFLVVTTPQEATQVAAPIVITVNWTSGLRLAR
jgi:Tol biopolymer transport system component